MTKIAATNALLTTCKLEPIYFVWVELADRDDDRVRRAVTDAVGLEYGSYKGVAFESATGMQFFQPLEGSKSGDISQTVEMPARILSFSIPQDAEMLAKAIEAIRHAHSYEEPVIMVSERMATRADYSEDRKNPNRWWNRGFDI